MLRISKIICLIMLSGLFFIGLAKVSVGVSINSLKNENVYKAIVKIYTYYLDENNNFAIGKVGFGVIINEDGLTLTNEHTVTVRDSLGTESPVAFKVCLTREDPYQEPVCNYTADLLGKDNKNDLALIKIKFFNSNYPYAFDYLELSSRQVYKDQRVYAYGYPVMAGDTIFGLVGAVVGTTMKNGLSMVQNSALAPFGSDGGVLLNTDPSLIGITSDVSKGTGDVLSVDVINSFKDKYPVKTLQNSAFQKKFNVFLNKLIDAKTDRKFTNEIPHLELSWEKGQLFVADTLQNIGIYNQVEVPTIVTPLTTNHITWVPDFIKQLQHSALVDNVNSFREKLLTSISSNFIKSKIETQEFNSQEFNKMVLDHLSKFKDPGGINRTVIKSQDISVVSPIGNDGWFFNLSWTLAETIINENFLNSSVNKIKADGLCVDQGNVSIAGKTGRKVSCQSADTEFQVILVGSDNYLISVIYSHGKNPIYKTSSSVDYIIRNLIISDQPNNIKPQPTPGVISQEQPKSEVTKSEIAPLAEPKIEAKVETPLVTSGPITTNAQLIKNLGKRFIGRILLRVEAKGEAWYLSPKTNQAHYLANGAAAYQLMREQGVGITNKDLAKIPVGLSDLAGADTDADGLTDALEQALGTNPDQADTDADGHTDKAEIETGYDPLKAKVRMAYNSSLTNRFKGRILLQVESRGQAWYINPKDGKRYFLGTAEDAYQVMRKQSMGIAERDFAKL